MNRRTALAGVAGAASALAGCLDVSTAGPGASAARDEREAVSRAYRVGMQSAVEATEALRTGVEKSLNEEFEAAKPDLRRAEQRGFTGKKRFGTAMEGAQEIGASRVAEWAARGRRGAGLLEASASTEQRHIQAVVEGDPEIASGARAVSQQAAKRAVEVLEEIADPERADRRLGL